MMDIEKLAREAGLTVVATLDCDPPYSMYSAEDASLRRFAALVAEEAAKVCEEQADRFMQGSPLEGNKPYASHECAAAIRVRFKA